MGVTTMSIDDFENILYMMKNKVLQAEYKYSIDKKERLYKYTVSAQLVTGTYITLLNGRTHADFEQYLANHILSDSFFVDNQGKFYVGEDKVCALCFNTTYN